MNKHEYILNNNKKGIIFAESYNIQENANADSEKFILAIDVLPLDKISDNGFAYNVESIKNTLNQIVGLPFCDNHIIDGSIRQSPPFGHLTEAWIDDNRRMLCAKADIDPEEKLFIRKAKRGDIGKVSIQIMGNKVVEKEDGEGNIYNEAYISRWLEISSVISPGFVDTNAKFESILAESIKEQKHGNLKNNNIEDMNTTNSDGAVAPAKLSGNEDKDKKNGEQKKIKDTKEEKNMDNTQQDPKAKPVDDATIPKPNNDTDDSKEVPKQEDAPTEPTAKKPEQNEEDDKPQSTIVQEDYENDMSNITDVLEKMNARLDELEKKVNGNAPDTSQEPQKEDVASTEDPAKKDANDGMDKKDTNTNDTNADDSNPDDEESDDEEPEPPKKENMKSSLSKNNIFFETGELSKKEKALNKAVREFLKK